MFRPVLYKPVTSVDEALRLLNHMWGRIEKTQTKGPYLSQDVGRAVNKIPVAREVFEVLLRAGFIQKSPSQRYFDKREIYELSPLGRTRVRGIRSLRLLKPTKQ